MKPETWYRLIKPIAKPIFYQLYRVKEGRMCLPETGAYLLIGHHVSGFDPIIINAFSKRLIRFLYTTANNTKPMRARMLHMLGMIPFEKKSGDFNAVRRLKRLVDEGKPVGIYPEGEATWDGVAKGCIPSTAKLVKLLDVPVYGVRYEGAYLSKPRWSQHIKRGRVYMTTFPIMSRDDIKDYSIEQIQERMDGAIFHNEWEWQEDHHVTYRGIRRAEYIERLLYKCPECDQYNTLRSHGNRFSCRNCGVTYLYTNKGTVHVYDTHLQNKHHLMDMNIGQWTKWQRRGLYEGDIRRLGWPMVVTRVSIYINQQPMMCELVLWEAFMELRCMGEHHKRVIEYRRIQHLSVSLATVLDFQYEGENYRCIFSETARISIVFCYDLIQYYRKERSYDL